MTRPVNRTGASIRVGQEFVEGVRDGLDVLGVGHHEPRLAVLDGSCRTPIAAYSVLEGETLKLRALVALPDGSVSHRAERSGGAAEAASRRAV